MRGWFFYIIAWSIGPMDREHLGKRARAEDEQSTCEGHPFDGELSHLRRHFYSPALLRSRVYEYIYHQTLPHIRRPESLPIVLCLLCMALSEREEAGRQGRLSEEGMWKERVQQLRQVVAAAGKECISDRQIHFIGALDGRVRASELLRQYESFLEGESHLLYQQSERAWRMLQLYAFAQALPQAINTEFEVDHHLDAFTLQLAQKENEIRLQLHIQSCTLESEQTGVKQMMKAESYLPQEKQGLPAAYPPGFTVKQMMLLEISIDTISLVERCEAHECPYLLFSLPFLYLLAEALTYYSHPRSLLLYRLFLTLIARVSKAKLSANPQLPPSEIDQCLMDVLNFPKLTSPELLLRMGKFLERHSAKMSTFIPVYYHIFAFHAFQKYPFVEELFSKEGSIGERRRKMKERVERVFDYCQKYNNDAL